MKRLSLRSLVQLDYAALFLVLLTFPWTFLFPLPPAARPHPFLWAELLLFLPAVFGYLCDWRIQRRIHRGLLDDLWNQTEIEAAASLLSLPRIRAFLACVLLMILVMVTYLIAGPSWKHAHTSAIYPMIPIGTRLGDLRRRLIPAPDIAAANRLTDLSPIHSAHWGER